MNISEILPYAPKFRIDGIYYELNANERTAEVTHGEMAYSGCVVIPQTVEHENATYSVTSIGKSAFSLCAPSGTAARSVSLICGSASLPPMASVESRPSSGASRRSASPRPSWEQTRWAPAHKHTPHRRSRTPS